MIIGESPAIRRALALAERYARSRLPILLVGPTGTGKELFAHHIHERSGQPGPLVEVNCCALPRDMVESLLFGHRRGAFTGAIESTVGYVERSDGGTLFLDELESLAFEAQGKLLRVLETGDVERLGIGAKRHVDLRVVSAVQDDISGAVDGGRFRRDLFQRVAGVVIKLPPLSTRPEDVVPLRSISPAFGGGSSRWGWRACCSTTPGPATSASCVWRSNVPGTSQGIGRCRRPWWLKRSNSESLVATRPRSCRAHLRTVGANSC